MNPDEKKTDNEVENSHSFYNSTSESLVHSALQTMDIDDAKRYKDMGRDYFENLDMESVNDKGDFTPISVKESIQRLLVIIKSGMHPSFLTENDKQILSIEYSKTWYEEFGYTKEDLNEIITTTPSYDLKKQIIEYML